jgi:hypothetical protein
VAGVELQLRDTIDAGGARRDDLDGERGGPSIPRALTRAASAVAMYTISGSTTVVFDRITPSGA